MWMGSRGVRGTIDAGFIRSIDPAVTLYAVHSTEEMTAFPKQWGVSAEKMRLCPYYCDVDEPPVEDIPATGSYVFAGGNSLRDYEPLLEAARALPDTRFVLATKVLTGRSLPPNVTAGPTSSRDYVRLAAGASVVVTPVQSGMVRAAGQQTYLNAMSMGRIVVVNEAFGVRDHISHMVDGVIVDGSADSYVGAIAFALDPFNESQIRGMQAAARHTARTRFSRKHYVERLFGIGLEAGRMSGTGSTGGKVPMRG
jgi:glycosyltransferase involved in cell wall biosynthesis